MKPIDQFTQQQGTREGQCPEHGTYESKHVIGKIWSVCPACIKASYAAEQKRIEEETRTERLKAWEKRIGQAGIPERFQDRRLTTYETKTAGQERALAVCASYAHRWPEIILKGSALLLCGKPGTGKTHLAVGIGMHAMEHYNATVLFTTAMRMMRRVKETYNRNSDQTESQAIAEMVYPDLLILDEVGVQFGSDTEKQIFFDVLNERYEKRKPTIFLSNLALDTVEKDGKTAPGLKSFLGSRVYDRLMEDGAEYLAFTWESYRGKGA